LAAGKPVGAVGRLNAEITTEYKFRQPVFVAEIDLETLLTAKEQNIVYQPLAVYPSIVHDVTLLVKRKISFSEIQTAIYKLGFELCRNVGFVDVYEGKGINGDERSITVRLNYRSDERTLLDEEVDSIHREILQNIENKFGATQRI
jgi:phenylalanyl-tRNA synthetase beta chain